MPPLSVVVVVMFVMMLFVLPRFKTIFEDMGAELPWITRAIMGTSDFFVAYWTRGVTGFVGPESKPRPLTEKEVITMGVEKRTIEVSYQVGDLVSVIGGPFDIILRNLRRIV